MKASGVATGWATVDRFDGGAGWIAHPDETMQRASHALVEDGDVWVVDPVDVPGLDDFLADLGEVVGVIVLIDRHSRDADAIAERHDVPIFLAQPLLEAASEFDRPVESVHRRLGDTEYGVFTVVDTISWTEVALYGSDSDTLVLGEALGTAAYYLTGSERIGVHPMLRINPPETLGMLGPERILVGHGHGIHDDATDALRHALDGARRRAPRLYWETLRNAVGL